MKRLLLLSLLWMPLQAMDTSAAMSAISEDSTSSTATDMSLEFVDGLCPVCKGHSWREDAKGRRLMIKHADEDPCVAAKLHAAQVFWPKIVAQIGYDKLLPGEKQGAERALEWVKQAAQITSLAGKPDPSGSVHMILGTYQFTIGLLDEARQAFECALLRGEQMASVQLVQIDMITQGACFSLPKAIDSLEAALDVLQIKIDDAADDSEEKDNLVATHTEVFEFSKELKQMQARRRGETREQADLSNGIDCRRCNTMGVAIDALQQKIFTTTAWQTWSMGHACGCEIGRIMLAEQLLLKFGMMQFMLSSDSKRPECELDADYCFLTLLIEDLADKQKHPYGFLLSGLMSYLALRTNVDINDADAVCSFPPRIYNDSLEMFEQAMHLGSNQAEFWLLKMMYEYNPKDFDKNNGSKRLQKLGKCGVQEAQWFLSRITPEAKESELPVWWGRVFNSLHKG